MRSSPRVSAVVLGIIVWILGAPGHPAAQQARVSGALAQQQPAGVPAPAPAGQTAPPVVRFAPEGIGLDDVVRMTLQYDPNLQRQQAAVQSREGLAQELRGAFDATLSANVAYERRVQELTEARKKVERDKREKLQTSIDEQQPAVTKAQAFIPILDSLRASGSNQQLIDQVRTIDPSIADILQLYNTLIAANANNPAVLADLQRSRDDFINKTLADLETSLKDQVTSFNDQKLRLANLGPSPDDEVFYNGSFQLRLSKLFRNGVQLSPFLDGRYEGTNFRGKPRASDFGGKGLEDLFTFHAGTDVNFALLRGRGSVATGAPERAAIIETDAGRLDLQHQASVTALTSILAYWDLRAAQDTLDVVRQSADLQATLLRLTQGLIDAGDLPAVELARAQASDARAKAQLENAQRQYHQARVALATAMGIAATQDDDTLPRARDPFPAVPDAGAVQGGSALVGPAPDRRLDLSASVRREDAGRVNEAAARTNLRSRLDLATSTFYTALEETAVSRAIDRWVGPSTSLSLALERPFGNNLYRGQLVERQADTRARQIASTDLRRQIGLGVLQAAGTLADTVAQVRQAEAAVGFYKNIYDADVARFQTGDATLIDTVLTQQQQTEALLSLVAARQQLARLIAELRYQTGTLVLQGNVVAPQNLVTVPPAVR